MSFLPVPARADGVQITMHEEIQVHKAALTLGDIVEVQGDDMATVLRVRQIRLGAAPRIGAPVQLQQAEVTRWIRERLGLAGEPLSWSGAKSTRIVTQAVRADQDRLTLLARTALQTWLTQFSKDSLVRIDLIAQSAPEVWLPEAAYTYAVRPIADGVVPQKSMEVWVEVSTAGQLLRSVPVRFSVSLFRSAWVSAVRVATGGNLSLDHIELKTVDIAASAHPLEIRPEMDPTLNDSRGLRVRRDINAGEILSYTNTESYPVVVRGDMVTLRSVTGAVRLEGRGQAMEDGVLGQLVHFKSSGAMHPVIARISAPGLAEIE